MANKLCECGCGKSTTIAYKTRSHLSHVKGKPVRFIQGHHLKPSVNGGHGKNWKGGFTIHADGYMQIWRPNHPHADSKGYVLEHVLIASEALGRPLPNKAVMHHMNGNPSDNRNENLILCENQAYHLLLHKRQRAFDACGNADWVRCRFCKKWDTPNNLYIPPSGWGGYHRRCSADYQRKRKGRNIQ